VRTAIVSAFLHDQQIVEVALADAVPAVAHRRLRHASPATTSIYAKTDQVRLAVLARPWPTVGGAS
jgi:hypothetical protein